MFDGVRSSEKERRTINKGQNDTTLPRDEEKNREGLMGGKC